jgi:predicted metal-dependent HD superfamily phosphohydrolase
MDLSSLAAPWPRFLENNRNITAEYLPHYPTEHVRLGRTAFLESMLSKPSIFLTETFGTKYEWVARNNIRRWLQMSTGN